MTYIIGRNSFIDWLVNCGYMNEEDVKMDAAEMDADLEKVKNVAPKLYNLLMCLSDH